MVRPVSIELILLMYHTVQFVDKSTLSFKNTYYKAGNLAQQHSHLQDHEFNVRYQKKKKKHLVQQMFYQSAVEK